MVVEEYLNILDLDENQNSKQIFAIKTQRLLKL